MVSPNGSDLITSIVSEDACVNNGIAPGKYWSLTFWNFSDRNIGFFLKKHLFLNPLWDSIPAETWYSKDSRTFSDKHGKLNLLSAQL